ncbi:MAG: metallophosphoesterase [Acidobacteria bacterium]|nr:metallophosphoesterase [Acidobacteriota bacterium]
MKKSTRRSFLNALLGGAGLASVAGDPQSPLGQASQGSRMIRFAVASDGHFGQPETDFQRFHRELAFWLNEERSGKGLDFVIFNGDLIHDDPKLLPRVKTAYDEFKIPYLVVKGNHDKVSPQEWKTTWGYEENHAFVRDSCAFLLVSTSNEEGKYLCANADWLSNQLAAHKDSRRIFIFMHINQNGVTRHAVSCPEISALLQQTPNVAAVFHGHDHDQDNVIYQNGRAYFFDGRMGGNWGTPYRGYRIVEVNDAGMVLTYQCNPQAFYVNSSRI